MDNSIKLNDILSITKDEYQNWTLCLNNANDEGIYSFQENPEIMIRHLSWKKAKDSTTSFRIINTSYCLQFLRLDKDQKYDCWLFMGAFLNKGIINHPDGHETYDLELIDRFSEFRDRLIIRYKKKQGPKQAKINIKQIEEIELVQILEKPYIKTDIKFSGYNNVSLSFSELRRLIIANPDEWRLVLSNVNCIYVITDESNGKLYVGSTYGENGVWGRWSSYVETDGTGNDKDLKFLVSDNPNYAFENFRFTILETILQGDSDYIIKREQYWKKALSSRENGYNNN